MSSGTACAAEPGGPRTPELAIAADHLRHALAILDAQGEALAAIGVSHALALIDAAGERIIPS